MDTEGIRAGRRVGRRGGVLGFAFALVWAAAAPSTVVAQQPSVEQTAVEQSGSETSPRRYCHIVAASEGVDAAAAGAQVCIALDSYAEDVCRAVALFADRHSLPRGFFARLIWTESRFRADAVSPMNAQGIAQFIPTTAAQRGLANPFNPVEALAASSAYLSELAARFGSLGLAAVAYNAGESRAQRVLDGDPWAPLETQNYVAVITGRSIAEWVADPSVAVDYSLQPETPFHSACLALATTNTYRRFRGGGEAGAPPPPPWGVQIAVHNDRAVVERMFRRVLAEHRGVLGGERMMIIREARARGRPRPRFTARVGRETRDAALSLCQQLRRRGAACTVARNGR